MGYLPCLVRNSIRIPSEGIDKRLEEMQNQLLQLASTKTAYDDVVNEIYQLRDLKQEALNRNAACQAKRQCSAELTAFLEDQYGEPIEFDEKLNKRLIEKITAFDDRLIVELKSGVEIGIDL